jgi:hypothetical protein
MDVVNKILGEDIQGSEGVELNSDSYAFEQLERVLIRGARPAVQKVANAIARGLAAGATNNPRAQSYFNIEDLSDLNAVFESRMTRLFLDSTGDSWAGRVNLDSATRDASDADFLSTIEQKAEDWVKTVRGRR